MQAEVFLREVKYHLEHNETLRAVFGEQVSAEKWDVREIMVRPRTSRAKESTISCVGVGGPVVSRHYDVIIADDLIDEDNSRTEGQRQRVHAWFHRSLGPTLEPDGRIHLLGTRYHYADLYGTLIEGEYAGCHQVLKAIGDDGQSPWPEKFTTAWLEGRRRAMGTMLFNGQYQNDVEAMKGRLFKSEWLRFYDTTPPDDSLRVYQGVDLAISQKQTADYFAHVTIGVDRFKNIYVLDAIARRLTFKAQTDLIIEKKRAYRPMKLLVEAVAYQQAQVDELRRAGVFAHAVKTSRDKVTRFMRLAARFEAGQVLLPRGLHEDLVEQLLLAPEGKHDDLVDALEMAVAGADGLYAVETGSGANIYPQQPPRDRRDGWRAAGSGWRPRGSAFRR